MDNSAVFLIQTDTTVGFLSKDRKSIDIKKNRLPDKEYLTAVSSFCELKNLTRVPDKFKKLVRRAKKTSFIFNKNNISVRVVSSGEHYNFLNRFGFFYSSSANLSGEKFNDEVARNLADIICEDNRGLFEAESSKLYRLGREKIRRLR